MFDIGTGELLALAFVALLVFGPERLPEMAAKAGRLVRQLRAMADNARADIGEHLGPEFTDLKLSDLQPRNLVRKHLLDGLDDDGELRRAADPRRILRDLDGPDGIGSARKRPGTNGSNGTAAPDTASNGANGVNGANGSGGTAPVVLPPPTPASSATPYDTDAT